MIFVYKNWERFCKKLYDNNIISISLKDVDDKKNYISLKHDVETNIKKAYRISKIESKFGHCGVFYVQAYLLKEKKNVNVLLKMQQMGHEITYHHDVMDSNKGDIDKAILEFEQNIKLFEAAGFNIETVCQHGNPLIERKGYNSNRDFFRSEKVKNLYPQISDIMVDFKYKKRTEYKYYSDAGRKFKYIYDPLNNDVVKSDEKNIEYSSLNEVWNSLDLSQGNIISIHPHRWTKFTIVYLLKNLTFKVIRKVAKILYRIPFLRKFFNRYYYLAKKI